MLLFFVLINASLSLNGAIGAYLLYEQNIPAFLISMDNIYIVDVILVSVDMGSGTGFDDAIKKYAKTNYGKSGIIIIPAPDTENDIDISAIPETFEWMMFLSISEISTVNLKSRPNQIKNISVWRITLNPTADFEAENIELIGPADISDRFSTKCHRLSIVYQFEFTPFIPATFQIKDETIVCETMGKMTMGQLEIDVSKIKKDTIVLNFVVNAKAFHVNTFEIKIVNTTLNSPLPMNPPKIEYMFEVKSGTVPNVPVLFIDWDKIAFTSKPLLRLISRCDLAFTNTNFDFCALEHLSLKRDIIRLQNPLFSNEIYFCHQYCGSEMKYSADYYILNPINSEQINSDMMRFSPIKFDNKITTKVHFYSPTIIPGMEHVNLAKLPKVVDTVFFEGDLFYNEVLDNIEFTNWFVDVDNSVYIDTIVINQSRLFCHSDSSTNRMKVNKLSLIGSGSTISGKINIDNAYVDLKNFKDSFDSMTLENLHLRIYLNSENSELFYDTRGWEFKEYFKSTKKESDTDSTIIVLSSSTALATKVNFYLYMNKSHTITLNLRRTDIKNIKGIDFTVFSRNQREGSLVSVENEENEEIGENDILLSKEDCGDNCSNSTDESGCVLHVIFDKETWDGNKLGDLVQVFFRPNDGVTIDLDEDSVPDNFEVIIPKDDGDTQTKTTEDYNGFPIPTENQKRKLNLTIIIGVVVPAALIIAAVIFVFIALGIFKAKKKDPAGEDENNQLILDNENE